MTACRNAGYTNQRDIGRLFGVKQPMVSQYKSGQKMPELWRIVEAAPKLGVCVEWLLTGRGPRTPLPEWLQELSGEDRRRALAYLHISPADRILVDELVEKLTTIPVDFQVGPDTPGKKRLPT